MITLLVSGAFAASSLSELNRLAYGSNWHCNSVGSAESYSFDLLVDRGKMNSPMNKRFTINKIVGQISLPEQFLDGPEKAEMNEYFRQADADIDPYYFYQQYTLRAGGLKTSAMFSWRSKKHEINLDVIVYDWDKKKLGNNYETRYGLSCKQTGIAS